MEAAVCRERLGRLLQEETTALTELSDLLEREHTHLLANDVAGLDAANHERQRRVARIIAIDEERRALCLDLDRANDPQGLQELLHWCDPRGTLAGSSAARAQAAARCRQLNDRNGALVGARLQHVQARLSLLLNQRRDPVTYDPRGRYGAEGAGRVLATEA
ncbi:MAG TPA: flagellar protein FlgN [Steroidobacteraceae bacterium]